MQQKHNKKKDLTRNIQLVRVNAISDLTHVQGIVFCTAIQQYRCQWHRSPNLSHKKATIANFQRCLKL